MVCDIIPAESAWPLSHGRRGLIASQVGRLLAILNNC